MRFTTNVGSFDMVLNPTDDPNLQPLVDNIVAYIGLGKYHFSAVNRADNRSAGTADDFVLQMGSFLGFPPTQELFGQLHQSIEALSPVIVDGNRDGQVDFSARSNTRGTVSMALQAGNPNSGTSSFFINLGDNSFLNNQGFVPFAEIRNMTTVDRIMALSQTDLSDEAGQSGSLAFTDVPIMENGRLVVVTDVDVLEADANFSFVGPIASALQLAARNSASNPAATAAGTMTALLESSSSLDAEVESTPMSAIAIPEPSTLVLGLLGGLASLAGWRRRLVR